MSGVWRVLTVHIPDINYDIPDIVHIPNIGRCPEYGQGGLGYLIAFFYHLSSLLEKESGRKEMVENWEEGRKGGKFYL